MKDRIKKGDRLIMFGLGDFSDVLAFIAQDILDAKIDAYCVHREYMTNDVYRDKPVVPFEILSEVYSPNEHALLIGFIGKKMFQQREAIYREAKRMGYVLPNLIHPSSVCETDDLGDSNIILQNTSIESHCSIGCGNIIWQNVVLPHHNRIGSFNNLAPSVSFSGYASAGDHCFIGNNVAIKNRVRICDYAFIGAGSYISSDVPSQLVMVPSRSYSLPDKSPFDFL